MSLRRPVFLLGAHKSGTSLLRALFDGHPDVFVAPLEMHYFPLAGYWVEYNLRRSFPRSPRRTRDYVDAVKSWIRHTNASADRYADSMLGGAFDLDAFDAVIERLLDEAATEPDASTTDEAQFAAYVRAVYVGLVGSEPDPSIRLVEKSVENAEFAQDLLRIFPDAAFVHIVRNPYSTLVALRQAKRRLGYPPLHRFVRSLRNSYYFLDRNPRHIARYNVIRYEDLAREPETTMRELCSFLDLPFHPVLATPTSMGQPWTGNSSRDVVFSGVSTERLDAWKQEIAPLEARFVRNLFAHVVRDYGYETFVPRGSPWLPHRGERPDVYLANRALLATLP